MRSSTCHCGQPARTGQRYCKDCHAAFMREWRKTNRLAGEARKRANARSYLHTYVKRGSVKKLPCEVCGTSEDVHGHHDDYDRPLQVRWLCARHHHEHHRTERSA